MLEAMACGTLGAIPDTIIEERLDLLWRTTPPECIVKNVICVLSFPDLEWIAEEGRRFVEEDFSFEKTVESWKGILQSIERSCLVPV